MTRLSLAPVIAAARAERRWLARLLSRTTGIAQPQVGPDVDSLAAYPSEEQATVAVPRWNGAVRRLAVALLANWVILAASTFAIALTAVLVLQFRGVTTTATGPESGTLTIETTPAGIKVLVDGEGRGVTPLTLSLPAGRHAMTLVNGAEQRHVALNIVAGREASHYYEFGPKAPAVSTGSLSITAGTSSRVSIDGRHVGVTPLVVTDLAAGEHLVAITGAAGTIEQRVTIDPGATSSMNFSFAKTSGPTAGWVSVAAPFDVQVFEGSDLVGSGGAKVMLAAGRHTIRFVNEALGYTESQQIDIVPGKVSAVKIEPPRAMLSANARPWADVSIDGTNVGQTPIANVSVTIGPHEVVFRHPGLGEQRQTITVTARGPNRFSADLTRK